MLLRRPWRVARAVDMARAGLPTRAVLTSAAHTSNTIYAISHTQIDCLFGFALCLCLSYITVIFFGLLKFSLAQHWRGVGWEH